MRFHPQVVPDFDTHESMESRQAFVMGRLQTLCAVFDIAL